MISTNFIEFKKCSRFTSYKDLKISRVGVCKEESPKWGSFQNLIHVSILQLDLLFLSWSLAKKDPRPINFQADNFRRLILCTCFKVFEYISFCLNLLRLNADIATILGFLFLCLLRHSDNNELLTAEFTTTKDKYES